MKKPEAFNEWIKKQIEENPEEAPQAAWQQISDDLDLEDSWQGIRQDLELDNLWSRIDTRLHVHDTMLRWEKAAAGLTSAFVLVLLSLPLMLQLSFLDTSQEPLAEHSRKQHPIAEEAAAISNSKEHRAKGWSRKSTPMGRNGTTATLSGIEAPGSPAVTTTRGRQAQALPPSTADAAIINPDVVSSETAAGSNSFERKQSPANGTLSVAGRDEGQFPATTLYTTSPEQQTLALLHYPAEGVEGVLSLHKGAIKLAAVQSDRSALVVVKKEKKNASALWRIGVGASGRISALLNEKTMRAMEKSSLTTPVPTYRSSLSLQAEKTISPKLTLLGDLMLYSTTGQRYQEYQGGYYGTTDTKLRYSQLNVLAAFSPRRLGLSNRHHTRLLAGISGGWLHQATLEGPLGVTDLSEEYRKATAAVVVGYEYYVPLMPGLWMGYGLRGHMDLLNMYAGTAEIPAAFRQTRNAFLDFTISFKYELKKK